MLNATSLKTPTHKFYIFNLNANLINILWNAQILYFRVFHPSSTVSHVKFFELVSHLPPVLGDHISNLRLINTFQTSLPGRRLLTTNLPNNALLLSFWINESKSCLFLASCCFLPCNFGCHFTLRLLAHRNLQISDFIPVIPFLSKDPTWQCMPHGCKQYFVMSTLPASESLAEFQYFSLFIIEHCNSSSCILLGILIPIQKHQYLVNNVFMLPAKGRVWVSLWLLASNPPALELVPIYLGP